MISNKFYKNKTLADLFRQRIKNSYDLAKNLQNRNDICAKEMSNPQLVIKSLDTVIQNTDYITIGDLEHCKVTRGQYGSECNFSKPLQSFYSAVGNIIKYVTLKFKGKSTSTDAPGECFLRDNANIPLSTSSIHDCQVLYLYNEKTKTHALYHIMSKTTKDDKMFYIPHIMPEGFTHASIVLGDKDWIAINGITLSENVEIINELNPSAKINIYHDSSRFPEIVGYNGVVSEIKCKNIEYCNGYPWDGQQASFKVVTQYTHGEFDFFRESWDFFRMLQKSCDTVKAMRQSQ